MNPFATATDMLADLRAGRVTSSELTEMYIDRIEKLDGRLNAVVERDFERAREQCKARSRAARRISSWRLPSWPARRPARTSGGAWNFRRRGARRSPGFASINGQPAPYMRCLVYPSVATVAGQPATAFPVGLSHDGLPISLQAIGPCLEDRTPIRFAGLLAKEIGGFTKPGGYDARSSGAPGGRPTSGAA